MVYKSMINGFISKSFKDKIKNKQYNRDYIIYKPIYNTFNPEKIKKEVIELLGKTKYDFRGLIINQLVLSLTGKWIGTRNQKKAIERAYCYESVSLFT